MLRIEKRSTIIDASVARAVYLFVKLQLQKYFEFWFETLRVHFLRVILLIKEKKN